MSFSTSADLARLIDQSFHLLSGSIRKRSLALGRNMAGSVGGYLPKPMAEMWEPSRDFAFLKLPTPGVSSVVAVSSTTPQVMVVTSEGYFYSYNIDLENGGECTMMKRKSYCLFYPSCPTKVHLAATSQSTLFSRATIPPMRQGHRRWEIR